MAGSTIADAIESLRSELSEAIQRGEDHDLRFKVEAIELELSVASELNGEGGISFTVLGVGASAKAGGKATNTHRVKLTLKPTNAEGDAATTLLGR